MIIDGFKIEQKAEAVVVKKIDDAVKNGVEALFGIKGKFYVEHWRDGKCIGVQEFKNGTTTVGLAHILNTQFASGSQITTWYAGLVDNSGFSAFATGDTMSSHAGWTEWGGSGTKYTVSASGTVRGTWGAGTTATASITNASAIVFDITEAGTVYGIFITSGNLKAGTTGTLWATAAFAAPVSLSNGDQLRVTYTLSAT